MSADRPPTRADVLIVGGGPAGLAAAIRARTRGHRVVLLDGARPPIDKACGEGLMPDGLGRLEELGVVVRADWRSTIRGVRYVEAGVSAAGRFPGGVGWGVPRPVLHRAMVRRATEVGVDLRWGLAARGLSGEGVRTDAGLFTAPWIIGADGLHSRMRRWAGIASAPGRQRRFGLRRHYAVEPWTDLVEVHWTDGCEAYVTPVGPRSVGIAMLGSWVGGGFDALLARFPSLKRQVESAPVASDDRGAGPFEQRVSSVTRGNLALIGDASGYVDAITGEGLALSFHHAFAAVSAIERGDLRLYAAEHRRIARLPMAMTRLLLGVERRPRLRRRLIRTLAGDAALFSRLLGVHARQRPSRTLGVESVRLALRMIGA